MMSGGPMTEDEPATKLGLAMKDATGSKHEQHASTASCLHALTHDLVQGPTSLMGRNPPPPTRQRDRGNKV